MAAQSLYEKYGGFGKLNKIVMAFYDRLLDSDDLGPYFDGIEMSRLIDHQTKFVASQMGGPASFTDDQLGKAHASLSVTHSHFDELKQILQDTLNDHGIEAEDSELILQSVESRRSVIVDGTN